MDISELNNIVTLGLNSTSFKVQDSIAGLQFLIGSWVVFLELLGPFLW